MGCAYGDSADNEGKTRDEIRRVEIHTVIFEEAQEEVFHNNVPDPDLEKLITSGSAVCYTAVPGEKPLYDDEPRSAKEVDAHQSEKQSYRAQKQRSISLSSRR